MHELYVIEMAEMERQFFERADRDELDMIEDELDMIEMEDELDMIETESQAHQRAEW